MIRGVITIVSEPKVLSACVFFGILYIPFVMIYGLKNLHKPCIDFPSFWTAAVGLYSKGMDPYSLDSLQSLFSDRVWPYLYPPPSLLLFAPLSMLTYEESRIMFFLLNHLLIVVLCWSIPHYLLGINPKTRFNVWAVSVAYILAFTPLHETLAVGNVNILLLVCILAFWVLARRNNSAAAGLFLALAIVLKTYPVLIIPLLVIIRRMREVAWSIAWLIFSILISFMAIPIRVWKSWLSNVLPYGGYGLEVPGLHPPAAIWNQSINGFFSRLFTSNKWSAPIYVNPDYGKYLTIITSILVVLVSAYITWLSYQKYRGQAIDHLMLIALPAIFLVAPWSWGHHLTYVLPPIILLLNSRCEWNIMNKFIYFVLVFSTAAILGLLSIVYLKIFGVLLLWIISIIAALSDKISLPIGASIDFDSGKSGVACQYEK